MHHISFGNVLKEARIAKGLDLASVSRELRIRQDIIVAIENSDFSRMPSRGYARNMIIAYARLVGLNPQDMSRMYLDQEYAYQVEQAHRDVSNTVQMHRDSSSRAYSSDLTPSQHGGVSSSHQERRGASRSSAHSRSRTMVSSDLYDGSSNNAGRRVYSQSLDTPQAVRTQANQSTHRSRRSAMVEGKYTNLYSAPRNIPNPNQKRNRLIAVVVGVIVVIVLVCALFLSHCGSNEAQTNIPVTGVENDSSQASSDENKSESTKKKPTEKAPTEFTFTYKVADGSESYIEVYIDEKTKESSTVTGPKEGSYTCSSTLRFVSTETAGVTATINGEEVKLSANDNGIVNQTYKFSDILNQWYKDHPDVKREDASQSDSGSSQGSSKKSSDSNDNTSSSSKKSSDSDDSDSNSGSSSNTSD